MSAPSISANPQTVPALTFEILPAPADDEGEWRLEAARAGVPVGHAKFDVGPGHLLLLQITVPEVVRRQGIATAMLRYLAATYERPISVEDFFPDGAALFGGHYTWRDDRR